MRTFGIFVLVLLLLSAAAGAGWVLFTRIRAHRLGLPAPALSSYLPFGSKTATTPTYGSAPPAAGGVFGWLRGLKKRNARTAAGAYEEPLAGAGAGAGAGGRRGFGPLDDDAWDARVGYGPYEEQELGVQPRHARQQGTAYAGDHHGRGDAYATHERAGYDDDEEDEDDDQDQDQDQDQDHHHHHHRARGRTRSRSPGLHPDPDPDPDVLNPFDDDAEPSNLGLRGVSPRPIDTGVGVAKDEESPTERRSVFREDV